MPLHIIREDITRIRCDAIVNPTNERLIPTGGADLAIHRAAGEKLAEECRKIGHLDVAEAAITSAFDLPAKYVIHTVGPVWRGHIADESLLRLCYRKVIELADSHDCTSIAIPLISAGLHGFPKDKVLRIASEVISRMLVFLEMDVYLVVFDKSAFEISTTLFDDVQEYIDNNYAQRSAASTDVVFSSRIEAFGEPLNPDEIDEAEEPSLCLGRCEELEDFGLFADDLDDETGDLDENAATDDTEDDPDTFKRIGATEWGVRICEKSEKFDTPPYKHSVSASMLPPVMQSRRIMSDASIDDYLRRQKDRSFADTLFAYIDERKISDVECYKRSNVGKKTFSKIKCNRLYRPSKVTAVSFAIGLRLSLEETQHLLSTAGLCLSDSFTFDLIIKYFVTTGNYKDIFEVNEVLYKFDQPLLGV